MGVVDNFSLTLAITSFLSSLTLILVCIIIPKTRKNPGQLIFIQAIFQAYLDMSYIIVSRHYSNSMNNSTCYIISVFFFSVTIQALYFLFIFTVEIYIEIKSKFIKTYSKRFKVYYLISLVLFVFFLVFGILYDGYGEQEDLGCFYKTSSVFGTFVTFTNLIFNLVWWIVFILSAIANNTRSKTIKKHLFLTFIVITLITVSQLTELIHRYFNIAHDGISLIFVAPVGFTISIFRLWNKKLLREVGWKICPRRIKISYLYARKSNFNNPLINFEEEEASTIGEFFDINSIKVNFI
jgi:hypothetical protein